LKYLLQQLAFWIVLFSKKS